MEFVNYLVIINMKTPCNKPQRRNYTALHKVLTGQNTQFYAGLKVFMEMKIQSRGLLDCDAV
jgi:hypothetical protein